MYIDHDVLFVKYVKRTLDLETAKKVIESRLEYSNGNTYPLFVDISQVKFSTKEAREYSSHGDALKLVSATALWGASELTKMMANFFLASSKPTIPVKFFSKKSNAIEWLGQFKHSEQHIMAYK